MSDKVKVLINAAPVRITVADKKVLVKVKAAQGAKGADGQQGLDGQQGEQGQNGLSAYQIAVANGFVGTESEWLESLAISTLVNPVKTTITGDGSTLQFPINGSNDIINASAVIVAIDGVFQEPIVDYSVSNGNIIFTSPIPNNSKAIVICPSNAFLVAEMIPADGSVTSEKLDTNIEIAGQLKAPNQTLVDPYGVITREAADARYQPKQTKVSTAQINSTSIASVGLDVTGLTDFSLDANSIYKLEFLGRVTLNSNTFQMEINAVQNLGVAYESRFSTGLSALGVTGWQGGSNRFQIAYRGSGSGTISVYAVLYFSTINETTAKITFNQWSGLANTASLLSGAICTITKITL